MKVSIGLSGLITGVVSRDSNGSIDIQAGSISYDGSDIKQTFSFGQNSWNGFEFGKCEESDISSQTEGVADTATKITCKGSSNQESSTDGKFNKGCGSKKPSYKCTDVNSQWNYGYTTRDISLAENMKSFRMDYFDCCWPTITNDDLEVNSRPNFYLASFFFNLQNSSPEVKIPAVWTVTKGCDEQKLNLNPFDADGNTVKCRWASGLKECGDGCWNKKLSSLQLDENTCTITYSGSLDGCKDTEADCTKPIAIQVEDFDSNGIILSSVGVRFPMKVFRSKMVGPKRMSKILDSQESATGRSSGGWTKTNPIFPFHFQGSTVSRTRRDGDETCDLEPEFFFPTPADDEDVYVYQEDQSAVIVLNAQTRNNVKIGSFQTSSILGMSCSPILRKTLTTGTISCTWSPSDNQRSNNDVEQFCYAAIDELGYSSEQRCIRVRATSDSNPEPATTVAPEPEPEPTVTPTCSNEAVQDGVEESVNSLIENEFQTLLALENLKPGKIRSIERKGDKFKINFGKTWAMIDRFTNGKGKACFKKLNNENVPSELVSSSCSMNMSSFESMVNSLTGYFSWRMGECPKNAILIKWIRLSMQMKEYISIVPNNDSFFKKPKN